MNKTAPGLFARFRLPCDIGCLFSDDWTTTRDEIPFICGPTTPQFIMVRAGFRVAVFGCVVVTLTGCVTRGYKLADRSVPPAVALNLTGAAMVSASPAPEADPAAAASVGPVVTLRTVIVYHGPGSWKREAYWDEYVVAIANPGESPLVVTAANLHDGKNESLTPGDNPWKLESVSKTWWQKNALRETGTYLALGTGTVVGLGAAWAASWGTMFGGTVSAGTAAAGVVGTAAFFALPVVAGGTVYMNFHRKHQVQAEFTRRRLVLPLAVGPGQTAEGSFFFRITPGPQQLLLQGRAESQSWAVKVDLSPLAGLHMKAPASSTALSDPGN